MSEQPVGAPAPGGRTILGLRPRTALIAGGVVLAGALAYFWWRRRSSSSAVTSATASSSTYGPGYNGQLASELAAYLAEQASSASASTGTGTTGTTGTIGTIGGTAVPAPGSGTTTTAPVTAPPGTATGQAPVTSPSKPAPAPVKTAAKPKPATPSGVRETKVTAHSVTIAWDKTPNATTYRVRVTYQGKLVGTPHVVAGTSATVSGLGADHTYTFHVAAIGPGGTSAETNGPAVKTSRA